MTELSQVPAPAPKRQITPVSDFVPVLDTARFEHMYRIARTMALATTIPKHLQVIYKNEKNEDVLDLEPTIANCFRIVNQAVRWNMDPWAVADCSSFVYGKILYEGKLVAAVLDVKSPDDGRTYEWFGEPGTDSYGIRIRSRSNPEEMIEGTVGDWKTSKDGKVNKNWIGANTQRRQLKYRGDREWARMWRPAILLGVYTDDEMDDLRDARRAAAAVAINDETAETGLIKRLSDGRSDSTRMPIDHVGSGLSEGEKIDANTGEITGGKDQPASEAKPAAADGEKAKTARAPRQRKAADPAQPAVGTQPAEQTQEAAAVVTEPAAATEPSSHGAQEAPAGGGDHQQPPPAATSEKADSPDAALVRAYAEFWRGAITKVKTLVDFNREDGDFWKRRTLPLDGSPARTVVRKVLSMFQAVHTGQVNVNDAYVKAIELIEDYKL